MAHWAIFKDYYRDGINFVDTWIVLYRSEVEAEEAKVRLEAGQDMSWYDPSDEEAAAFLYVDQI